MNKTTEVAIHDVPRFLTAKDLERIFQLNKRTIARLCRQGALPEPLKVGGSNRWKRDDVITAIDRFNLQKAKAKLSD